MHLDPNSQHIRTREAVEDEGGRQFGELEDRGRRTGHGGRRRHYRRTHVLQTQVEEGERVGEGWMCALRRAGESLG